MQHYQALTLSSDFVVFLIHFFQSPILKVNLFGTMPGFLRVKASNELSISWVLVDLRHLGLLRFLVDTGSSKHFMVSATKMHLTW